MGCTILNPTVSAVFIIHVNCVLYHQSYRHFLCHNTFAILQITFVYIGVVIYLEISTIYDIVLFFFKEQCDCSISVYSLCNNLNK